MELLLTQHCDLWWHHILSGTILLCHWTWSREVKSTHEVIKNWKSINQFKEGGAVQRKKRKNRRKNILKYSHGHKQKFYPQRFHTMVWEMKNKLMKGKTKASKALKLDSIAFLGKAWKTEGLHKWEQVRSCRGNHSAYVSAIGKSLSCREYSKLVPNGLGFCHMVLIIRLKLHCHAFSVNEMDG